MELLQLTYFCSAAKTENFSKTAKAFSVPASNISQSIQRLENELGTTLFDRTSNRVTLNEQGKQFYANIETALTLINTAKTKLCDNERISGEIKILVETNRHIVTKTIEQYQKEYHEVLFFINHSTDESFDRYDLIITDRILDQRNFKKHLLVVDDLLLAMRKDHPLANKSKFTVKDLEKEKFISLSNKHGLYNLTNEICNNEGFAPNIVIQSDDPYYIRKYIEMGLGISFIPSRSWKGTFSSNIEFKQLVSTKRNTFVYLNTQKYLPKAVSLFFEMLLINAEEEFMV